MGVTGPGTRPRVLEGAFLGELARAWTRLEGAREGGEAVPCSNTWLQGWLLPPLSRWTLKGQVRATPQLNSWQEASMLAHHPSSSLQPENPVPAWHLLRVTWTPLARRTL